MGFKIDGLKELEKSFKTFEKNAKELTKNTSIAFSELFTSKFMQHHTSFSSIDELFEAGNFKIHNNDDIVKIPDDKLDAYISKHTDFSSWQEMLDEASSEYALEKLSF